MNRVRVPTATAITFVKHAWLTGFDALADVIEKCAASEISKVDLVEWFEAHKVKIR